MGLVSKLGYSYYWMDSKHYYPLGVHINCPQQTYRYTDKYVKSRWEFMNPFQTKKFNIETSLKTERESFCRRFWIFCQFICFWFGLLCFCLFMTTKP